MLKFDKASGLYYDHDSGLVYADEDGTTHIGMFNPKCSDAYLKLFLLNCASDDPIQLKKIRKKLAIQEIHDLPFITSTPEYCYAYVLYKIRKLSGLNQEEMAFSIGMSKSTYNKIENRILSPSLNNIHMAQNVFGITPVEFSQLYQNIQTIIIKFGRFSIPSKNSDFNSDEAVFIDNPELAWHEHKTPIHLYDEKIPAALLSKLDIFFQEILLEGKKRNMRREELQKEKEEKERKLEEEWNALSPEEQEKILEKERSEN